MVRGFGYRLSDVAAYFGREAATTATLLARLGDECKRTQNTSATSTG